jgi:hypothetical protein
MNSVAIMIGIFLITHGSLGESLVQCACHVLNKRPPQIAQLGVSGQDDPLDALPLARDMMKLVDTGEGRAAAHRHLRRHALQHRAEAARAGPRRGRGRESTCRCCCAR